MFRKVGLFAVLLALALLATGTAEAMPLPAGSARPTESAGVMARLWGWVTSLLQSSGGSEGIKGLWEGDSSHIDPNGNP